MAKVIVDRCYCIELKEFPGVTYETIEELQASGILETATPPFLINNIETLVTEG